MDVHRFFCGFENRKIQIMDDPCFSFSLLIAFGQIQNLGQFPLVCFFNILFNFITIIAWKNKSRNHTSFGICLFVPLDLPVDVNHQQHTQYSHPLSLFGLFLLLFYSMYRTVMYPWVHPICSCY